MLAVGALITGAMTAIFTGSLIAGVVMAGLTLLMGLVTPKAPKINLKPASLSDFTVTQADEGQPVPIVYGIVHIPGNIIYYGNLKVKEVKQRTRGGKGGGGGSRETTVGYQYYIDMWQAICMGKIEILEMYLNKERTKKPSYESQIFNDGTQNVYPVHLPYANKLTGISHIFWKAFFVGENTTVVPTVYFKVRRILNTGLPYENMDNGSNPAAVIFDLLTRYGEVSTGDINYISFQNAANYFYQNRIGINYVISSSKEVRKVIDDILNCIDSILIYDENGKIALKVMKREDLPVGEIIDDFIEFSFAKPSWNVIPNHFVGNFVEDGMERTLILENQAAKLYAGKTNRQEYDLSMFITRETALSRLSEIMKSESYPRIMLNVKLPLKYAVYNVGDVIRIKNSEIGFQSNFRIISVTEPKLDDNTIEMKLIQHTDVLFDKYFQNTGGTKWQAIDFELKKLNRVKVLELDYIGDLTPTYLILANKEMGFEEGFAVYISYDGTSYNYLTTLTTWAVAGNIIGGYTNNTYDIDDEVGFIFRPYKSFDEVPLSISRDSLFRENRFFIIGNEIVCFQNLTPYGQVDYKITSIVRGVLWTGKQNHADNTEAFYTVIEDNLIRIDTSSTFYIKIIPVFRGMQGKLSEATVITVVPSLKARTPIAPERLRAVRTGNIVNVDIYAVTKSGMIGAGKQNANVYTDVYPFSVEGSFYISTDGSNWIMKDTANFIIEQSGAFTLRVKHYANGRYSAEKTLSVGSADGEYIS